MNILVPEYVNQDGRRTLTQLLTAPIQQVNLYEAKRGAYLGNHFHKDTTEYFYVFNGTLVYNEKSIFSKGSLFKVEPPEKHHLECVSDVTFMTFLTKPYDKLNPDLYK